MFFKEIFHLLVEQTNIYYQQPIDGQAGPSHWLPDITTLISLALQMGRALKDTLHDYWSRLRQLRNPFYGKTMTRDKFFTHTMFSAFCRPFTQTWWRRRIWPAMETKDCLWHTERGNCKNSRQGYLQAVLSREKKMFRHQNLQTLWWIRI
jgi:hypothetical protein